MRGAERLRSGWAAVAALVLPWAIVRCNTDHEQLAERPGTGGAAGSTSSSGLTSNAATSMTSTQSSTTGSGGSISYTPDGDDVLTLVHGQVDAEQIAFCLGRADEGRTRFDAPPIPRGGLGYGDSFTLSEAEDLDFEHDAIELVVLTGEFDEDADCEDTLSRAYWPGRVQGPGSGGGGAAGAGGRDAVAGVAGAAGAEAVPRPALRAMVMPSIPANSLVLGRHYVMVFAGCMGGPGVVDDSGVHCGANHSDETPSLRPLLVPVSRAIDPARLSLQFLHASTATSLVDVQSVPAEGAAGAHIYLTSRVRFGVIAPQEPYLSHSSETLGLPQGAEFVVYALSGGEFRAEWTELRGASEIADGHSYLAILLGPSLGTDARSGFNESQVTLLPTDLGREE